ncbi:MAG: hypothetical protein HY720_25735 [Planctomycetes bacterium]|nr:hypothetical protein [Planctomycetota bacterium]
MKHCPKCGQSYEDWVEVCADCVPEVRLVLPGAALDDEDEGDTTKLPDRPAPPLESPETTNVEGGLIGPTRKIFQFDASDCAEIEALFEEKGIPCDREGTVAQKGPRGGKVASVWFALIVPEGRFEEAVELARQYYGLDEESATAENECGACGAKIPEGARRCPECELVVAPHGRQAMQGHPFAKFLSELESG